jgi:hypothetical protein
VKYIENVINSERFQGAKEILDERMSKMLSLLDTLKGGSYSKEHKGYTIMEPSGPLNILLQDILSQDLSKEMLQSSIEKVVVSYTEGAFTKALENEEATLMEKILAKTYQQLYTLVSNEVVDRFKPNRYKSLVTTLKPKGVEVVTEDKTEKLFGKTDPAMKALLVITLGVSRVVSETIMITKELLSSSVKGGKVSQTELATSLGRRLRLRLRLDEKSLSWPGNLYGEFNLEEALTLLRGNNELFFVSFASELVNALCQSKLFTSEITTTNDKSQK